MARDAPRRRRARPVADAPVDGLVTDREAIARGWMLALLDETPLDRAPGLIGAAFAVDAPALVAAVARALAGDAALSELGPGGSLCPLSAAVGPLAGAEDPAAVAAAVDALVAVVWVAAGEALRAPEPRLVSDLAERLARVGEVVREGAFEGLAASAGGVSGGGAASGVSGAPSLAAAGGPSGVPSPAAAVPAGSGSLWRDVLRDEVRDGALGGRPLSLLLAELEDADRVIASAPPDRADAAIGDFLAAVRGALGEDDLLVGESGGRAWVVARGRARASAHSLAARIAEAVGASVALGGTPLVASVGIAVLGEDGDDPDTLLDAAEEARFRASARGIEVSRRVPQREY